MQLTKAPNQPAFQGVTHSPWMPSLMEEGVDTNCTFLTLNDLNEKGQTLLREIMAYRNQSVIDRFLADNPGTTAEGAEKAWQGLLQFFTVSVMNRGGPYPIKGD